MAYELKMPQLGLTMEEGTVSKCRRGAAENDIRQRGTAGEGVGADGGQRSGKRDIPEGAATVDGPLVNFRDGVGQNKRRHVRAGREG